MTSRVYSSDNLAIIEARTVALLQASAGLVAASPRGVGDAVQEVLTQRFNEALGELSAEYQANFTRRSMADLAFRDIDGFHHVVDVKTHRSDTKFNMPNLTSVERLASLYEDDTQYFSILYVRYRVEAPRVLVEHVAFSPIEWFSWDCLTLGALGWGQIQIANANRIIVVPGSSRRAWMLSLCARLDGFYGKEVLKIGKRRLHFAKVRLAWEAKKEQQ